VAPLLLLNHWGNCVGLWSKSRGINIHYIYIVSAECEINMGAIRWWIPDRNMGPACFLRILLKLSTSFQVMGRVIFVNQCIWILNSSYKRMGQIFWFDLITDTLLWYGATWCLAENVENNWSDMASGDLAWHSSLIKSQNFWFDLIIDTLLWYGATWCLAENVENNWSGMASGDPAWHSSLIKLIAHWVCPAWWA
jgi:hypothetical protein